MTDFLKYLFGWVFFMYMMHMPCIDEKLEMNHKIKVV